MIANAVTQANTAINAKTASSARQKKAQASSLADVQTGKNVRTVPSRLLCCNELTRFVLAAIQARDWRFDYVADRFDLRSPPALKLYNLDSVGLVNKGGHCFFGEKSA